MREVLFTGLRVDTGEWIEGDLIRTKDNGTRISPIPFQVFVNFESGMAGTTSIEVIPETVSQFTGFLATDGSKIFDGQKLKCTFKDGWMGECFNIEPGESVELIVEFDCGWFLKNPKDPYTHLFIMYMGWMNVQTIITGSIHDKPLETNS